MFDFTLEPEGNGAACGEPLEGRGDVVSRFRVRPFPPPPWNPRDLRPHTPLSAISGGLPTPFSACCNCETLKTTNQVILFFLFFLLLYIFGICTHRKDQKRLWTFHETCWKMPVCVVSHLFIFLPSRMDILLSPRLEPQPSLGGFWSFQGCSLGLPFWTVSL